MFKQVLDVIICLFLKTILIKIYLNIIFTRWIDHTGILAASHVVSQKIFGESNWCNHIRISVEKKKKNTVQRNSEETTTIHWLIALDVIEIYLTWFDLN